MANKNKSESPKNDKKKERKERKKRTPKVPFLTTASGKLIELKDGKIAVSAIEGFDGSAHKPLRKSDFYSEDLYMDFKADGLAARSVLMAEEATLLRTSATETRKLGTPELRKKKARMDRLAKQLAVLKAELAEGGVAAETAS